MAFINEYPYTNFNEFNLDWLVKTVKDLSVAWAETKTEWGDMQTEWTDYKNYIDNYFENLDVSQEISDKIDQMAADGYFNTLLYTVFHDTVVTEVGSITSAWIADNLLQETGYVIDNSLTVANAAADAKAAGDRISSLEDNEKYNIQEYTYMKTGLPTSTWLIGGLRTDNGNDVVASNRVKSYRFAAFCLSSFTIPDNTLKCRVYEYAGIELTDAYIGVTDYEQCGPDVIHKLRSSDKTHGFRILVAKMDDSDFTSAECSTIASSIIRYESEQLLTTDIHVPMHYAKLGSAGNEQGSNYVPYQITQYTMSTRPIKLYDFTNKITVHTTLAANTVLKVVAYDKDFNYLNTYDVDKLPQRAKYIKFYVYNNVNPNLATDPIPLLDLDISIEYYGKEPHFVFNYPQKSTATWPFTRWISYQMNEPEQTSFTDDANFHGITTFTWNNGFVILPPNYSAEGDPVPLILFMHGSDGYQFRETSIINYGSLLEFLANNGYAVADCSTLTNTYETLYDANYPSYRSWACYDAFYKYLTEAYNIKTDGCYIFGKSAGGQNTVQYSLMKNIPIKAAGILAGSIDSIINGKVYNGSTQWAAVIDWLDQLGVDTSIITPADYYSNNNTLWSAIVAADEDKFIGFNPFWMASVNFDRDTFATTIAGMTCSQANLSGSTTIQNIVNDTQKVFDVPIKLWHAVDDNIVPIEIARMFRKTVQNAGGVCAIHELPANTGQHHAVDTDPSAPTVSYETKYGGTVTIPVAYAELIEWFKQW